MSDLISLKITIENDANYLLFGDRICGDIKALESFCRNRYQDLQKNVNDFLYHWIDDDGDAIRITTDEDYQSFLQAMVNTKARVYVVAKNTPLVETNAKEEYAVQFELDHTPMQNDATGAAISSRPVHQHTICDVCDEKIVGHRYKCLTCHDYDLCMGCEAKFRHKDHLMLRIPKPAMVTSSQSTISRMLDRLRIYSARITSNVEKDLGSEAEPNVTAGNPSAEINGSKRAHARSAYRSKHSDDRRTNETSKTSRGGRSCGNDRKQNASAADETSGERSSKDTKEKTSVPSLLDYVQRCQEMMFMLANPDAGLNSAGKTAPWSSNDHVAVANVAAATAAAAAARATALANKAMEANETMKTSTSTPSQETAQSSQGVEQLLSQTLAPKQQKPATTEQQPSGAPPAASVIPLPFLPFVNLTWPTQEKLLVASENVSKLLDPLGLSFEIRHKSSGSPSTSPGCTKARGGEDDGAIPSTSASGGETILPIPTTSALEPSEQQEQVKIAPVVAEETSNIAQKLTQSTPVPVSKESKENGAKTQMARSDDKEQLPKAEKVVSGTLESDSACEKKSQAVAENEVDDDDDSQNTSSASLLTDDDQDLMEVIEDEEKASGPSKPPVSKEKTWTLIDLPQEHDEERVANAPLDAIAKLIGRDLSSPDKEQTPPMSQSILKEKRKDKTAEEKEKKHSHVDAFKAFVDRHYEYEILRRMSATEQKEKSDRGEIVDTQQSPPLSGAIKEMKPLSASPPNSGPSSSSSSGGSSDSRPGKSSRKSSSSQQKDRTTLYSHRPHVNHAIHTMMTMGFSNHNGWLTQLLESVNGDIPKALDLLLQHRH